MNTNITGFRGFSYILKILVLRTKVASEGLISAAHSIECTIIHLLGNVLTMTFSADVLSAVIP